MKVFFLLSIIHVSIFNLYSQKVENGSFETNTAWDIETYEDVSGSTSAFLISNGSANKLECPVLEEKNKGISQIVGGHSTYVNANRYILSFTLSNMGGEKPRAKIFIEGGDFSKGDGGIGTLNGNLVTHNEEVFFGGKVIHSLKENGRYEIDYYAYSEDILFRFAANNLTTTYSLDNVTIKAVGEDHNRIIEDAIDDADNNSLPVSIPASTPAVTQPKKQESKEAKDLQDVLRDLYN